MEFLIKINMDNAAFERMPEWEIDSILKRISQRLDAGEVYGKTLDTNGNTCGFWGFVEQDELVEAAMYVVDVYNGWDDDTTTEDILDEFITGAHKCQKAVAKEIARQVGVGL